MGLSRRLRNPFSLERMNPGKRKERLSRLRLEELEARLNLSSLVVGAAPGQAPVVKVFDSSGAVEKTFFAYESGYRGGVNVARGDVTGDGVDDVVVGRQSGRSDVKVFDGRTYEQLGSFFAFDRAYRGGVEVAVGNFGGEAGRIVVGMAGRGSEVKVVDGRTFTPTQSFTAFGRGTRGVSLAVGNLDNSPASEVVVASGVGGAPTVKGFDPATGRQLYEFAEGSAGRTGLKLTSGDFDGNYVTDVATAPRAGIAPTVSVWTRGTNGPELVRQFQPFGASRVRGLDLGTLQAAGSNADLIGVVGTQTPGGRGSSALTAAAARPAPTGLSLFDESGQQVQSLPRSVLGRGAVNAASGIDELNQAAPIPASEWMHIIDYSPTWPYWSITKPTLTVTKFIDAKTIEFTYLPDTMPWTANLFAGAHLYDIDSQYYYANSTIGTITGNVRAVNTLTLNGPDNFQPSIVGHQLVVAADQLSDSDFYNSAFKELWSTPRYTDTDGSTLTDLQVMQKLGVTADSSTGQNLVRLYDWGIDRGFTGPNSGVSEHKAFLDAMQAAGIKVIVPVSNYFLGNDAWGTAAPDASYSPTGGIPANVQGFLTNFLKSISADGQGGGGLHPAVGGVEVGNEIELNSGVVAGGDMTNLARRTLWWIVNVQQRLESSGAINGNTPNHIKFTSPVSNADEDVNNPAQKSWFQVFRHGAKAGDTVPSGSAAGTKIKVDVQGLEALKGADWYKTWFYNSYQTPKRGDDLLNLLDKYNAPRGTGNWNNQWPGEAFPVPLVLMELDYSIAEAGSEGEFFNIFANQQVQLAENFLRGEAELNGRTIENTSLQGYALFEFNQEPNKTVSATPDSEQTRGILKYYQDRNVLNWRTPSAPVATPTTPLTNLPDGRTFAPFRYPVYPFYSVTSDDGVRLIDKLQGIIRAPRKK